MAVYGHADRASASIAVFTNKVCEHIQRLGRRNAFFKWNEDHLISIEGPSVPLPVLSHKHAMFESRQMCPRGGTKTERSSMSAEGVVGHHGT